jgi:hypothetical protein
MPMLQMIMVHVTLQVPFVMMEMQAPLMINIPLIVFVKEPRVIR